MVELAGLISTTHELINRPPQLKWTRFLAAHFLSPERFTLLVKNDFVGGNRESVTDDFVWEECRYQRQEILPQKNYRQYATIW